MTTLILNSIPMLPAKASGCPDADLCLANSSARASPLPLQGYWWLRVVTAPIPSRTQDHQTYMMKVIRNLIQPAALSPDSNF